MDHDFDADSFEFERKFWVEDFPEVVLGEPPPTLIVQNYLIAEGGSCLRIRLGAELSSHELSFHRDGKDYSESELVLQFSDRFNFASVGVKGPPLGGTRYEKEMTIAPEEAVILVKAGRGRLIAKQRYGLFMAGDGWNIDVFSGANYPLIVAECERSTPVTGLEIPKFCTAEITDKLEFTNDNLASLPYSSWAHEFLMSVTRLGRGFREDMN